MLVPVLRRGRRPVVSCLLRTPGGDRTRGWALLRAARRRRRRRDGAAARPVGRLRPAGRTRRLAWRDHPDQRRRRARRSAPPARFACWEALALAAGSIVGAQVGARLLARADERKLKLAFGVFLLDRCRVHGGRTLSTFGLFVRADRGRSGRRRARRAARGRRRHPARAVPRPRRGDDAARGRGDLAARDPSHRRRGEPGAQTPARRRSADCARRRRSSAPSARWRASCSRLRWTPTCCVWSLPPCSPSSASVSSATPGRLDERHAVGRLGRAPSSGSRLRSRPRC